jgi:hypothetical protein
LPDASPIRKTLRELDGPIHGTVRSTLAEEIERLWQIPIGEFRVEDLRLVLLQNLGVPHLLPIALEYLERDPFAEGDLYPGDLLRAVLGIQPGYWDQHLAEYERACTIATRALSALGDQDLTREIQHRITERAQRLLSHRARAV